MTEKNNHCNAAGRGIIANCSRTEDALQGGGLYD